MDHQPKQGRQSNEPEPRRVVTSSKLPFDGSWRGGIFPAYGVRQ